MSNKPIIEYVPSKKSFTLVCPDCFEKVTEVKVYSNFTKRILNPNVTTTLYDRLVKHRKAHHG